MKTLIFFQMLYPCDFKDQKKKRKKANSFSNEQYLVVDDRNFKSLLVT